jgi:hypothetical protein
VIRVVDQHSTEGAIRQTPDHRRHPRQHRHW